MRNAILDHEFYCCKCGTKGLPILRRVGKEKEKGHLKKLYCYKCKMKINHLELGEYGDKYG